MPARPMVLAILLAVVPATAIAGETTTRDGDQRATLARKPGAGSIASQLPGAVHDALRQEATSRGSSHDAALVELTRVYRELGGSDNLTDSERTRLRALVRNRLARSARKLQRELTPTDTATAAARDEQARVARLPGKERTILHQQAPPQGAAPPGGGNSPAQELIDLITSTIAPDTWEINGGLGTIRYFSLGHLLVVRQTAEVHGQLADTVEQLRRN